MLQAFISLIEGRIPDAICDAERVRCPRAVSQAAPGRPWTPFGRHKDRSAGSPLD
jgi:hypothetical protein